VKLPVDNDVRLQAANDLDTTLFVEAAAGTGKTTALVARILSAVKSGRARLHEVVAITFTEKAAGELKIRLREELEKQLTGEKLREALSDLERAPITTIHSFCASVLRERPVEAKVDPQFAVADDLQRQLLLDEAWAAWLETELGQNPSALRHALFREVRVEELESLATMLVDNRARLTWWPEARALNVRAVLGRIAESVPALERNMKHCVSTSENFFQRAQMFCDTIPQLAAASDERVVAVLTSVELTAPRRIADFDFETNFREAKKLVKDLQDELEEFAEAAGHNFLVELVTWLQGFVGHFQECKRAQAMLDFDDLLEKTRDLLRENAGVRGELQRRYRFLLVDEFQDTDPVQSEIVLTLAGTTPGKLFIVGDPKQSIYGFRRADIEMYAGTRRTLEKTGRVLQFQQNFRSKSTILDWVNEVFAKLIQRPSDGDYQPDYIPLKATFETSEPRVTVLRPSTIPEKQKIEETRRAEAEAIARYLHGQVADGKCKWGDVALLFRSFTGVEIFTNVFVEQGVPFRIIGGRGYYQRQEIQTLISLLCALDNPNDTLHLVAALRSPLFGWTDEQVFLAAEASGLNYLAGKSDAFDLLRELHELRHSRSIAAFVEHVLARTHFCQAFVACAPDGAASVANLLKSLELARQLEAAGLQSLRGFVRQLRRTVVAGIDEEPAPANEESDDVVRLLSMHKSKGLEFPVVVLADLAGKSSDSGARLIATELRFAKCRTANFDAAKAEQDKRDEAEEIRLLYVGATRARERLVVPVFAKKGERLDLLMRGFEPVAGKLVEVDDGGPRSVVAAAATERTRQSASLHAIADRRAWQQERAALLERVAKPLARVSPSKLGGETEPSEEESTSVVRAHAIELGVVVHAALERMDATGLEGKAQAMVERALKSELMARVKKADEVYRELPFMVGGMEGKIDLLFREGKRWTLVDYKTDARPEVEKYRQQMRAYVESLQRVAGIEVAEVLLFFVATGEVKTVTL